MPALEELAGWGGVPVVIALVQAVKWGLPDLDRRFLPLVAVLMAALWELAMWSAALADLKDAGPVIILTALAAIGLFSGTRAVAGR